MARMVYSKGSPPTSRAPPGPGGAGVGYPAGARGAHGGAVREQVPDRQPQGRRDVPGVAPGVAPEQHPAVRPDGQRQAVMAVVVGGAPGGPLSAAALHALQPVQNLTNIHLSISPPSQRACIHQRRTLPGASRLQNWRSPEGGLSNRGGFGGRLSCFVQPAGKFFRRRGKARTLPAASGGRISMMI